MKLTVHHETSYAYPESVFNSVNEAWLRPLTDERQSCLSFRLTTRPASEPRPYTDYFGNTVYHFGIHEPHLSLSIVADAQVVTDPIDIAAALEADQTPVQRICEMATDQWLDFLAPTPLTAAGPELRELAGEFNTHDGTVSQLIRSIAQRIHERIVYNAGSTSVSTAAEESATMRSGVCQDYTHVFLSVCRLVGLPARYISGYLCSDEAAASQASHAWPEVLMPEMGWIGLDVTNDCLVDDRYVRVAIGRDYADVPPIRGAFSGPRGSGPDIAVSVLSQQQ
jgi:transglutaminase-like putative cysteine protease